MSTPHQCPVCYGKGIVPPDFYTITRTGMTNPSTSVSSTCCRACLGTGILWVQRPPEGNDWKPTGKRLRFFKSKDSAPEYGPFFLQEECTDGNGRVEWLDVEVVVQVDIKSEISGK